MKIVYLEAGPDAEEKILKAFADRKDHRIHIKNESLFLPIVLNFTGKPMHTMQEKLKVTNYRYMPFSAHDNANLLFSRIKTRMRSIIEALSIADQDMLILYPPTMKIDVIKGAVKLCLETM